MNESIRPKFLDLKEGAIVVSLKPFVPVNARLTERNVGRVFGNFPSALTAKLIAPVPRSTILARYLMSRRESTTLEVFHGGADGDTIISTGSTERGT